MALTPDDVVNKRFQPTKYFREGYDQDEVDEFLDEVVVELRRLNTENDDLRRQLAEAGSGTPAEAAAASPVSAASAVDEPVDVTADGPAEDTETAVEPAAARPSAAETDTETAAGILAMAQRMHDDYVGAGIEQRDKIIAEAQVEASGLVADAEDKSRSILGALEEQKDVLERKVEQLRSFERDYRSRLKAYIEGQLRDLDARGSVATETADA